MGIRPLLLVAMLSVLPTLSLAAQGGGGRDSLPPGVTPAMVARGKTLYEGRGLCMACHGIDAKGSVGPNLRDTVWLHHDGSYDALVEQIQKGITAAESKTGVPMPARGGSALSDEEVRAAAAYVWTLSRRPSPR